MKIDKDGKEIWIENKDVARFLLVVALIVVIGGGLLY